jgi:TM2 domain-containing membrane protein YozV
MKQGSSGNVIAALVSFFIPGLGQLTQGRVLAALLHFVVTALLWLVFLGWLGHIFSCVDAARWKAP